MYRFLSVLVVLFATHVHAKPVDLGDGLTVDVHREKLWDELVPTVVRGGVRVSLPRPDGVIGTIHDVRVRALPDNSGVEVSREVCESWEKERYTRAQLLAMAEYAAGRSAEALALVPDNPEYRLARLRALLSEGLRDEAVALLVETPPKLQPVLLFHVRKEPALSPLLDTQVLKRWQTGSGRPRLPAYDPVRRLVMVSDFETNTVVEGHWVTSVLLIDADTGKTVYRGADDVSWLDVAGLLGFESSLSEAPSVPLQETPLVFDFGIKIVSGRRATKVFADKKLIGRIRGDVTSSADGIPSATASLFDDRIVVSGEQSVGEGCGADQAGYFSIIPLSGPGPVAFQAAAATTRARRALLAGQPERALSELAAPDIQNDPAVIAFRALIDASTGRVAEAKAALAALPEFYRSIAVHDVLAPVALRPEPTAQRGNASDVPAYNPTHRTLVTRDIARPRGLVFTTSSGSTRIIGFDPSPEFYASNGYTRPLASVKPHKAAEGDWRAVFAGPPELRVSYGAGKITFAKAGVWVGGAACDTSERPEVVWFFDGAVAFDTSEDVTQSDHSVPVPFTRFILAKP